MTITRPIGRPLLTSPDVGPHRSGGGLPWEIGGGRAPSWTPADLGSKMTLWLKGGVGLTEVAGPKYSAWADQSGNARDFTQSTDANRPLVGAINGIACPDFTGGSVALLSGAVTQTSFLSAAAYEIAIVASLDAPTVTRVIYGESGETKGAWLRTTTGAQSVNFGGGDVTTAIALVAGTTYHLLSRYSESVLTCDAAGTTQTVASSNVVDLTGLSRIIPDGRVGEVVICNAVLSTGERASLKAYFAARFGSI